MFHFIIKLQANGESSDGILIEQILVENESEFDFKDTCMRCWNRTKLLCQICFFYR